MTLPGTQGPTALDPHNAEVDHRSEAERLRSALESKPGLRLLALPHYRLERSGLYFMTSKRSAFDLFPGEDVVWRALLDQSDVRSLNVQFGERFNALAARLLDAGICVLVEPPPATSRRKVLVVEPHSDDAALSIGATMFQLRHEVEFTLLTVNSQSNYTSAWHMRRQYFSVSDITALRSAESALFIDCLHGRHIALGVLEAPLRYAAGDWSLEWFNRHRISISANNNHRVSEAELVETETVLRPFVSDAQYDEIWFPLGVGTHSDHEMVRNAMLRNIASNGSSVPGRWVAYQDVPYDSNYPAHVQNIVAALRGAGAKVEHQPRNVAADMERKKELLKIFASQFKVSSVQRGVDASAAFDVERVTDKREHFWRIDDLSTDLPERAMYIDAPQVENVVADMRRTKLVEQSSLRGVSFVFVAPPGRWRLDSVDFADRIGGGGAHVLAFRAAAAEFEDGRFTNVEVTHIAPGIRGWLNVVLHGIKHPFKPLVLVSGVKRKRLADRLRWCFPFSPFLVVESFDHFAQAFKLAAEPSSR